MIHLYRFSLALSLLLGSFSAWAQSPADYSWTTANAHNVTTVNWTPAQIGTFLTAAIQPDDPLTVGAFKFADLLGDGNIELVATADVSGRAFFGDLLIVRRTGSLTFSAQHIAVLNLESLTDVVTDLNGDGKKEIIVPVALTPYLRGDFPEAKWTGIYTWTGSLYEEATSRFAEWYRSNVVPGLQQALDTAKQRNDSLAIALAQLQLDKAIRVSGGSAETGLTTAQLLATNSDPNLRIWAAYALADIGTPAALVSLNMLLQDANPSVARYSQTARAQGTFNRCERIPIAIESGGPKHIVNIGTSKPIVVALDVPTRGETAIVSTSATFGTSGIEQSLIACDNAIKGIRCRFRAGLTELQLADGVATLLAKRADGRCVIGRDVVQVVNIPNE